MQDSKKIYQEYYFDSTASSQVMPEVLEVFVKEVQENYANPAATHRLGFYSEQKIKDSAKLIANNLVCDSDELIFTSGASESINHALKGYLALHNTKQNQKVLTLATEHKATLESLRQIKALNDKLDIEFVKVDRFGRIDFNDLRDKLNKNVVLITFSAVNNVTGTIQDLDLVVKYRDTLAKQAKIHVDYVQAWGKLKINLRQAKIDMASFSAHKIGGLKGIGLLYLKNGIRVESLISGGSQQNKRRAGTLNMPGIVSMAKACELACRNQSEHLQHALKLRNHFLQCLASLFTGKEINKTYHINSSLNAAESVPHILNISFPSIRAETLVNALSDKQIYVATQSACSAGNFRSYVLQAQNLSDELSESSLRFSFNSYLSLADCEYLANSLFEILSKL